MDELRFNTLKDQLLESVIYRARHENASLSSFEKICLLNQEAMMIDSIACYLEHKEELRRLLAELDDIYELNYRSRNL